MVHRHSIEARLRRSGRSRKLRAARHFAVVSISAVSFLDGDDEIPSLPPCPPPVVELRSSAPVFIPASQICSPAEALIDAQNFTIMKLMSQLEISDMNVRAAMNEITCTLGSQIQTLSERLVDTTQQLSKSRQYFEELLQSVTRRVGDLEGAAPPVGSDSADEADVDDNPRQYFQHLLATLSSDEFSSEFAKEIESWRQEYGQK